MIQEPASQTVLVLLAVGMFCLLIPLVIHWVRSAPVQPDPWDDETAKALEQPDIEPVCHHCSAPQPPGAWFCPHCGTATGPYNNIMPWVYVFSQGEVLRNGVADRVQRRPLIVIGYFLLSLHLYMIFAPIYWYFLIRNLWAKRQKTATAS